MKELVNIYKNNRAMIESFIISTMSDVEVDGLTNKSVSSLFSNFRSLDFVYSVDNNWHQNSPSFFRGKSENTLLGAKKHYLSTKIQMKENGTFLSSPYINTYTGKLSITYVKRVENGYIVFDFNLVTMLKRLKLLEANYQLQTFTKYSYGFMGFALVAFSFFLGIYAIATFLTSILPVGDISLEATFKSIIALTLGLAIFDLAKTILEQEVFSRALVEDKNEQNRVFSKFLISIVIALSIESLMVVFKIALSDYKDMIHALYLILGVALMIFALGAYNYFTKSNFHRR